MSWAFADVEIGDMFATLVVPDVWGEAWSSVGKVWVPPAKKAAKPRRGKPGKPGPKVPEAKGYVSPYRQRKGVVRWTRGHGPMRLTAEVVDAGL